MTQTQLATAQSPTDLTAVDLSVVIPTFNEGSNTLELVRRLNAHLAGTSAEILFVDDGTDDLPEQANASQSRIPIQVHRRVYNAGGLSGAVVEGIRRSAGRVVVVMDGDLQHPPEKVAQLVAATARSDIAVASRYIAGGAAGGLGNGWRRIISRGTGSVSKVLFPRRLRECSDPMSGFFAIKREAVNLDVLKPRGFKILLEIIARSPRSLRVAEVPFEFGDRHAGESHATMRQGVKFIYQLAALRVASSKAVLFLLVGLSGVLPNLGLLVILTAAHMHYILAAIIATQVAVLWNFLGAELLVWKDHHAGKIQHRFVKFLAVGETDLVRLPFVVLLVQELHFGSLLASGLTMLAMFLLRFSLSERLVYGGHRSKPPQVQVEAS